MDNTERKIKTEFKIPVENFAQLSAKLEKLNRRALKIGCPVVAFQVIGETSVKKFEDLPSGFRVEYVQHFKIVKVEGDAPIINGWIFVAKVEVTKAGILINAVPGEEVPHSYRDNKSQCEHCQHNRRRSRLYIVRDQAGNYKQVGASCLRDFLGHRNPEAIAQMLEHLYTLDSGSDEEGGGGWGNRSVDVNTIDVLTIAHSIVSLYGYTTKAEAAASLAKFDQGLAREAKTSTSETVFNVLFPPSWLGTRGFEDLTAKYRDFVAKIKPNADDSNAASEIMNWMIALNPTSDYLNNLKVIGQLDNIEPKRVGIAVSAVWAWMKETQKATKQRQDFADKSNNHVGEEKKRDEMTLILKDVQIKSSMYQDEVSLVKFEDEAGNAFVWWTGAITRDKDGVHWKGKCYSVGTKFKLRATVKRHGEYKGRLTTTLGRCFLVEVLAGNP